MLIRLLKIAFIVLLLFFAYRFAVAKGWLQSVKIPDSVATKAPWLKQINDDKNQWSNPDLEKLGADGMTQINILAGKAKEAGSVAQNFVGQAVQVDENKDQNISEKAFEYGRYIYCQEVVKQYESVENQKF